MEIKQNYSIDKTRQDKTRQDKTRQDKTRQSNVNQRACQQRFLGSLYGKGQSFAGAVWDKDFISPTLTTMQGGGREPMIAEKVIKKGCRMIGRNPERPTSRLSGLPTEQRIEINETDNCNALTTVQNRTRIAHS